MEDHCCLPTERAAIQGHLVLNPARNHSVPSSIVSGLAVHQLEGVRFLNDQLREYSGIFLNDESGLGKCHQIVALLSGSTIGEARPSIILCPNRERMYHWMYHLDVLSPSLRSRVHPKSLLEVANELPVLQTTDWQYAIVDETRGFMTAPELERLRLLAVEKYIFLSSTDLLDELMVLSTRLEFSYGEGGADGIKSIIDQQRNRRTKRARFRVYLCTRRFILRRRVKTYLRHLPLIERSKFLECYKAWKLANDIAVDENREPLGSVEYTISTVKSQESRINSRGMTPQATKDSCRTLMGKKDTAMVGSESTHDVHTAATVCYAGSEPLFDLNETDTEQMPPLRVESDTPSEEGGTGSIPDGGICIPETVSESGEELYVPETVSESGGELNVPDTATATNSGGGNEGTPLAAAESEEYMQFGQQISTGSTSTQPVLADDRYYFPQEKFLPRTAPPRGLSGSSVSIESIPNGQPPTVAISSSDSPARGKSPPLFEDETDNDTLSLRSDDDDFTLLEELDKSSPIGSPSRGTTPKVAPVRRQPSFSTPIAKLMYGSLANATPHREVNVSSYDMFSDSPIVAPGVPTAGKDNVFEITKNNVFPNRILVLEETDAGTPRVSTVDDSSDDDVQFVDATTVTGVTIDLAAPSAGTPKSNVWNKALAMQRTPPSGGSNVSTSPGRGGWLGKSLRTSSISPQSRDTTPSTSKSSPGRARSASGASRSGGAPIVRNASRRRKLEEVFKNAGANYNDETKRFRNRTEKHNASR